MGSADSAAPLIWQPRIPAHRHLAADPRSIPRGHLRERGSGNGGASDPATVL
jgi:hypothetical protein